MGGSQSSNGGATVEEEVETESREVERLWSKENSRALMRVSMSNVNDVDVRGGVVEGQEGAGGAEGQVAGGEVAGGCPGLV